AAFDPLVVRAAATRLEGMNGAQSIDKGTHRFGQTGIGGDQVGPERIPTVGWDRHATQNGCEWRIGGSREVGMPAEPRRDHHRLVFLVRGAMFGDRIDLGMPFDMAEYRMTDRRLAELACHGDVLRVVKVLVAEEHNFPLEESVPNPVQLVGRQRPGQVNAFDLRTYEKSKRNDLDHWHPS